MSCSQENRKLVGAVAALFENPKATQSYDIGAQNRRRVAGKGGRQNKETKLDPAPFNSTTRFAQPF